MNSDIKPITEAVDIVGRSRRWFELRFSDGTLRRVWREGTVYVSIKAALAAINKRKSARAD